MPPRRRARAVFQSDSENESQVSERLTSSPLDRRNVSPQNGSPLDRRNASPQNSSPTSSPAAGRRRGPARRVSAGISFDSRPLSNDLQFLQDSITKSLEEAYSFGLDLSEANLLDELEKVQECMKLSIRLQKKLDDVSDSYSQLSRQIGGVNLSAYAEAIPDLPRTLFAANIDNCTRKAQNQTLPQVSWTSEKKFVEFCESAWELGPGRGNNAPMPSVSNDEDEIQVSSRVSLTCPVTLLPLSDPVRNSRCGHTYSRAGINSLTSNNSYSIHCPVGGCSGVVSMQSLVPDRRAETLIKRLEEKIYTEVSNEEPFPGNTLLTQA